MRLIDADALMKCIPREEYCSRFAVANAPTIKPQSGKWIRNDNGTWSCDQCNSWIPDEQHYYARFCLYCGAKMEAET